MTFQEDYKRRFGQAIESHAWVIQQRGVEGFAGRPDIQQWWQSHPEAVAYVQNMGPQGGQLYEGNTRTTNISGTVVDIRTTAPKTVSRQSKFAVNIPDGKGGWKTLWVSSSEYEKLKQTEEYVIPLGQTMYYSTGSKDAPLVVDGKYYDPNYYKVVEQKTAAPAGQKSIFGGGSTGGRGATGTWEAAKTVKKYYDPATGMMIKEGVAGGSMVITSEFFGFPSQQFGGSMTTATMNEPKINSFSIKTSDYYPTFEDKGWAAAPVLFFTGAAMTIPSLVGLGFDVLKTPFEVAQFGLGVVPAKISSGVSGFIESWTTKPFETLTMTAGSMAFSYGLGKAIQMAKEPVKYAGKANAYIDLPDEYGISRGMGNLKAATSDTKLVADYKFAAKDIGSHTKVGLQMGDFTTYTERGTMSKIFGGKVFTKREFSFGQVNVVKDITNVISAERGISLTAPKDILHSQGMNRLVMESPRLDIYQSATATKNSLGFVRTDVFKGVREIDMGSFGQKIIVSTKSKPFIKPTFEAMAKADIALGSITKTSTVSRLLSLPTLTVFPSSKTKQSKAQISISAQKTMLSSPQKSGSKQKAVLMNAPMSTTAYRPSLKMTSLTGTKLGFGLSPLQGSLQSSSQISGTMTSQLQTSSSRTTTAKPAPLSISPMSGGIALPSFSGGGLRLGGRKGRSGYARKTKYSPSIAGLFGFGKGFKTSKIELGVRIRRPKK